MHSVPTARLNHVREGSLFTVTMAENSSPEKSSPGRYGGEWSMPDACDRRCCCSSHAATARITHTRNACPVSSYVAGKRLEQTLAGHPRIAPSPFARVGSPHLPLTAVVWCLYRRPAPWATGQPHAKRKVGGAAGSATGALLAPTAPRRVAWLGYVPRAQLWRGGGGIGVCGSSRVRLRRLSRI